MTDIQVFGNRRNADDDDGNPIKIGGISRTTPPIIVAGLKRVDASFDQFGRQLTNTYFLRNMTATSTAIPTRAQETTLMGGSANAFLDLTTISGVNTSGAAIQFNIRSGTGGAVFDSITIPANSSATRNYTPSLSQSEIGQSWTVQNAVGGDLSDSPVTFTAIAVLNPGV